MDLLNSDHDCVRHAILINERIEQNEKRGQVEITLKQCEELIKQLESSLLNGQQRESLEQQFRELSREISALRHF